ncbi:MAG TPA: hypothetical protein VMW56_15535 [Candidatus Margulisiibacteriota bacterium]|nr:hypothetical protein [Candidatus Margulisiibacteriota bacterium]
MKPMPMLILLVAFCAAPAFAGATPHATTTRVGAPLTPTQLTLTDYTGMDAPAPGTSPSGDPAFDVTLPKLAYDAGEPVILTTHLRGHAGDIDGGTVTIEDEHGGPVRHGKPQGNGHHTVVLDASPGEHFVVVSSDAVVGGNSVHRATSYHYVVANGHVKIAVEAPHVSADTLLVPLTLTAKQAGLVSVSATLATTTTAVARADASVQLDRGTTTVDLPFPHADLVEPGPYRLVNVTVHDTDPREGEQLAGVLTASAPFNSPLAPTGQEPPGHHAYQPVPLVLPTPQGEGDERVNPGVDPPDAP